MKRLYIFALMVLIITILTSCNQTQASRVDLPFKVYKSEDQTLTFTYPSYLHLDGHYTLQSADWTNQTGTDKSYKIDIQIFENENNWTLDDYFIDEGIVNATISDRKINGITFKLQKGLLADFDNSPFYNIATIHNGKFYSLNAYSMTLEAEKSIDEIFASIVIQ